ncbi:MAG: exodeoxyribonuclease III [Sandaracinaceae bacterium]|nr:exodeoxyribonuclease III [Sandaracinaceae bacterium]
MRIVSWNVNGLRAVATKGFGEWLAKEPADVIGVQETRATEAQIPETLRKPSGFQTHFVAAERGGYSGVGLFARRPFELATTSLGIKTMDVEGRVQIARIGKLTIANVYFPNGSGPEHDNSRVPFKLRFYRRLFSLLAAPLEAGEPIVVMGDFNTAPDEIDLARPKENAKTSGFLPEERKEIVRWKKAGWVDSYRAVHPSKRDEYSWWSQRFGVRERNVGWRIDLAMLSPAAARHLTGAAIHTKVMGSDHCPISVELDDRVLG